MAETGYVFPKKEQAIVLEANESLQLSDYVVAIANIVLPKNILFASRMSNKRVCIYLSNKTLVNQVASSHAVLNIKDIDVPVRPLLNPSRRIIFSNVCPSVPHSVFENFVKGLGFSTTSSMSFLRAGIDGTEYGHILSFRRQIYVAPNESVDLPSSWVFKFEGVNYRIFLNFDDVCFKCKKTGHFANECSTLDLPTQTTNSGETEAVKHTIQNSDNATSKGPLDLSVGSLNTEGNSGGAERVRKRKRFKNSDSTESLTSTHDLLLPAKALIEDNNCIYPLNFLQMVELMDKAVGENDLVGLVQQFTSDIPGVTSMLYDIYGTVEQKSIQNRCKKTRRKLKQAYEKLLAQAINVTTESPAPLLTEQDFSNVDEPSGSTVLECQEPLDDN